MLFHLPCNLILAHCKQSAYSQRVCGTPSCVDSWAFWSNAGVVVASLLPLHGCVCQVPLLSIAYARSPALVLSLLRVLPRHPGKPLGIQIHALPGHAGQQIIDIAPGGPFANAGVHIEDIILEIDGQFVLDDADHDAVVSALKAAPETFEVVCATATDVDSIREPIQQVSPIKLGDTPPNAVDARPSPEAAARPPRMATTTSPEATPEKAPEPQQKKSKSPLMAMLGFGDKDSSAGPAAKEVEPAEAPAKEASPSKTEWSLTSLFSSSPKVKSGQRKVVIDRKAGGALGLNLSGFIDGPGAQIIGTQPDTTAAEHASEFQNGDLIISVNGKKASRLFKKNLDPLPPPPFHYRESSWELETLTGWVAPRINATYQAPLDAVRLLLSLSPDVRSSDDVIAFEGGGFAVHQSLGTFPRDRREGVDLDSPNADSTRRLGRKSLSVACRAQHACC